MEYLYENKTTYTLPLMQAAYKVYTVKQNRGRNSMTLLLSAVMTLAFLNLVLNPAEGASFSWYSLLLPLAAFGLAWSTLQGYKSAARRTMEMMAQSGEATDLTFRFADDQFDVETAQGAFSVKWKDCRSIVKGQGVILLPVGDKFYAVDLNGFTSGDASTFADFASAHAGK